MAKLRIASQPIPEQRKVCVACRGTFTSKSIRAQHCSPTCKYRTRIGEAAWANFQELVKACNSAYAQAHPDTEAGVFATKGNVVMLRELPLKPLRKDGAHHAESA